MGRLERVKHSIQMNHKSNHKKSECIRHGFTIPVRPEILAFAGWRTVRWSARRTMRRPRTIRWRCWRPTRTCNKRAAHRIGWASSGSTRPPDRRAALASPWSATSPGRRSLGLASRRPCASWRTWTRSHREWTSPADRSLAIDDGTMLMSLEILSFQSQVQASECLKVRRIVEWRKQN